MPNTTQVYVDLAKTLQIALIVAALVALGIAGVLSADAIIPILTLAAGYIFGNGKSAREGSAPAPLIGRRPTDPEG